VGVPFQLTGITTSPSPPFGGQAFAFTVSGSGIDPNTAVVNFSGPGCTPCTIANSALSSATSTALSGTATLAAGTFTVIVQNGSGAVTNGLSLTVSSAIVGAIQLAGITTTPNPPVGGQAFTFSITGTGIDPGSVLVTFSGPGCAPCTIPNTALSNATATAISGSATLPAGSFTVTAQNGATGTPSNGLSLSVSGVTGVAPQISAITTTPNQPTDGQAFTFVITGTGFDPNGALVTFTGPNCTPCLIANSALVGATSTQLSGTATLAAGNYTIAVQNGTTGAPSNGEALSVAVPAGTNPQISLLTTSPALALATQPFTFTIKGSGFDPATAAVFFTGPNCTPCSITSAQLSTSTPTELDGTASLAAGSYFVAVQNATGFPSNNQLLVVYPATGAAPQLSVSILNPNPPVHGQQAIFIFFGSGFDPNTVLVDFSGPSCTESACIIPNLDVAVNNDASAIGGIITFPAAGTYTVTAQNGPNGAPSNALTITVQ
jgi:hypothetical protein